MKLWAAILAGILAGSLAGPALADPVSVVIGVITASSAFSGGITIFGFVVAEAGFGAALLSFAGSIALGFVSKLLTPKPKLPNLSSFQVQARDRLQQFRQPVSFWRVLYGEGRVSGPLTFVASTNDDKILHLVITLASHEVKAIETVFLNDTAIDSSEMDASGNVNSGTYSGQVKIQKDLGSGTTQPFPDLESEVSEWTSNHIQRGRAKLYVRLEFDQDIFPTGVPNISAWTKGKKVMDTRTSTTAFSLNPAMVIRDYMTTSTVNGGAGATTLEFNDTFTNASANICDEIVSTTSILVSVTAVDTTNDILTFQGSTIRVFTGDRVQAASDGTLPTGLSASTDYFVIPTQRHSTLKAKLATTYANAIAGTAIDLTGAGSGSITLTKTGEPRYSMNGMIELDQTPTSIISDMLTAMGGRAVYTSGQWRLLAAAWTQPSLIVTADNFVGPLSVTTKPSRRERFNAVKGVYVTVLNFDQPSDYPPIVNATYEAEDNGERLFSELDLPYTNRPHMAQRLAKIELERHRQAIICKGRMNLTGLQIQAGDVIQVTLDRFGWATKDFEVIDWQLNMDPVEGMGCDVTLKETASDVFDWNSGLETAVDPAPNTTLPNVFNVAPPENLTIVETLYDTRGSAGVKARVTMDWDASGDGFVLDYLVQFVKTLDSNGVATGNSYTDKGRTIDTEFVFEDMEPGTYSFQVRTRTIFGVRSIYTEKTGVEVTGLLDPPTEPQNLTISTIGGMALMRWDISPDLDVKIGGFYKIRHSTALTGAVWTQSVTIADTIQGHETQALLPLKKGTYLIKAVDSSGIESTDAASVSTKQATVVAFTDTSTITEHTAFTGSTTNVIAGGGVIKLDASGLVDDIVEVSAVANWDSQGGITNSGTYVFSAAFDWGSVLPKRYTTDLTVIINNVNDLIDSRTGNVDDWTDWDGTAAADADARVFVRETDDDPSGSPTWSSWMLLDSTELEARATQFKCELTSADNSYNIEVSQLSVTAAAVT